ncbi:hypothetical protein B0H13DRAFT_1853108 [Mycena leptocephala]|nr:hypothetical protein B0H13DRAFT_1853108 [Mycena leptocephala]
MEGYCLKVPIVAGSSLVVEEVLNEPFLVGVEPDGIPTGRKRGSIRGSRRGHGICLSRLTRHLEEPHDVRRVDENGNWKQKQKLAAEQALTLQGTVKPSRPDLESTQKLMSASSNPPRYSPVGTNTGYVCLRILDARAGCIVVESTQSGAEETVAEEEMDRHIHLGGCKKWATRTKQGCQRPYARSDIREYTGHGRVQYQSQVHAEGGKAKQKHRLRSQKPAVRDRRYFQAVEWALTIAAGVPLRWPPVVGPSRWGLGQKHCYFLCHDSKSHAIAVTPAKEEYMLHTAATRCQEGPRDGFICSGPSKPFGMKKSDINPIKRVTNEADESSDEEMVHARARLARLCIGVQDEEPEGMEMS